MIKSRNKKQDSFTICFFFNLWNRSPYLEGWGWVLSLFGATAKQGDRQTGLAGWVQSPLGAMAEQTDKQLDKWFFDRLNKLGEKLPNVLGGGTGDGV